MEHSKKYRLLFTPFSVTRFAMHRIYANRINSRGMSRVFCDLRSQKTPRGILPVNSTKYRYVTVHFILQYFQICSEGCPEAAKWSDLTQDVADTEQSDSLVQERNRGCADQYEEYEYLAYQ